MPMATHPVFRPDLEVFEHEDPGGFEKLLVKDPVSQKYFRLSDYEYRFLTELDGTVSLEEAARRLRTKGRYYPVDDIKAIVEKAAKSGLLLGTKYGTAEFQLAAKEQMKAMKRARRLSSVYFLFIPLVNPDRFLEKTLWIYRLLWNRVTRTVTFFAAVGAAYLIVSGVPKIQGQLLFFFNATNLLYLWLTIAAAKLVHELAHAYTAKGFGLHVPEMGMAFLIFFPCLYCNTTDAWQLADRRQRMSIGLAGVTAEAALAAFAAYVWYFTKPGVVNSLAFYLMGVSLVSTVLFNGNPLMRFDGYFVLSDYLGIPNLYQKSFRHIRFLFLYGVLGLPGISTPAQSTRERVIFVSYGLASLAYRVFLYGSIVVGVYFRFDKTVGTALALLAFALFIVRPVWKGISTMAHRKREIHLRPVGSLVLVAVIAGTVGLLSVPIATNSVFPCFLDSEKKQKLTVPLHTSISSVYAREGRPIARDAVLFELDTSLLELELSEKHQDRSIILKQLELLQLDDTRRSEIPDKELELEQVEDDITTLQHKLQEAHYGITAPFNGVVTSLDPRMQPGYQPGQGVVVGELESPTHCVVHALVPEEDLEKVRAGQSVLLQFDTRPGMVLRAVIRQIKPFSERDLSDSPFSSRFGGELATEHQPEDQSETPLEAQYVCTIPFDNLRERLPLGITGQMAVPEPPRSIMSRLVNILMQTLNRESLI